MCIEPETAFAKHASNFLRPDKIRHLNKKMPRENFASIPDWAAAVAEEIKSVLLPATPGFATLDQDSLDPLSETRRTEVIRMKSLITTLHIREFLDDDLEQQERLDRRIARLIDELIEIKARKQVLRQTAIDDKINSRGRKDRS